MKTFLVSFVVVTIVATIVSSSPTNLGRITGGREALLGEAPYIVLFSNGTIFCSGSIILASWVLTAAHCLLYDTFDIIAGLHRPDPDSGGWAVQKRTIPDYSYFVKHDFYYDDNFDGFDVALVFISPPFELHATLQVESVGMPFGAYDSIPEGEARLYGWGYTTNGLLPQTLQVLTTNIISFEDCKAMLDDDIPLMDYNMCTEGPNGICLFDSGDPLVRETPNGVELIGVASWGESPCDSRNSPSVYTRVDKLMFWIDKTLRTFEHREKCKSNF